MPRKKVLDEEPKEIYEWDKPRIIIFFCVIGILIIGGLFVKHFFLDAQNAPASLQSVQGATSNATNTSSQFPSVQDVQHGVSQELSSLQQQTSKIDVKEIASSSPQVQQILNEIKQLPNAPGNIAKQTCLNICNNL